VLLIGISRHLSISVFMFLSRSITLAIQSLKDLGAEVLYIPYLPPA